MLKGSKSTLGTPGGASSEYSANGDVSSVMAVALTRALLAASPALTRKSWMIAANLPLFVRD